MMKKMYKIQVTRTFSVIDVVNVVHESLGEAELLAKQESAKKYNSSDLILENIETVELSHRRTLKI